MPPWQATAEQEPGPTYLPTGVISGAAASSALTCGGSGTVCARATVPIATRTPSMAAIRRCSKLVLKDNRIFFVGPGSTNSCATQGILYSTFVQPSSVVHPIDQIAGLTPFRLLDSAQALNLVQSSAQRGRIRNARNA